MCGRENSGRRTVKNRDEKSVQNKGSGQLIHEPVMRAFAVDFRRFRSSLAGRCQSFFSFCGRPFFRRILSSLHRKPDRRKRNAHCSAFRQSLHCLIAERSGDMQLGFRLCLGRAPFLSACNSMPCKIADSQLKSQLRVFTLKPRDLTHCA